MEKTFLVNLLGGNGLPPTTILVCVVFSRYLVLKPLGVRSLTEEELKELTAIVKRFINCEQSCTGINIKYEKNTEITISNNNSYFKIKINNNYVVPEKEGGNIVIQTWGIDALMSVIGKEENKVDLLINEIDNKYQDLLLK